MRTIRLTTALLVVVAATSCAPNPTRAEGLSDPLPRSTAKTTRAYVTQGGWGNLLLSKTQDKDVLRFELRSDSGGYECRMTGTTTITLQATQVDPAPGTDHCQLTMRRTERDIELDTPTPELCTAYCGHNGSLKGLYLTVDPMCTPDNVQTTLEQTGSGRKDSAILKKMTERCADTLPYSSLATLRLELAAAYDRKGEQANCLSTLSPYAADVGRSDDELTQGMTGAAAEEITGIMELVRKMVHRCERER